MNRLTYVKIVETLNYVPLKTIAVNTDAGANKAYTLFLEVAKNKFGFNFLNELKELGLKSSRVFRDYLNSANFRETLETDNFGKSLLNKIKFSKDSEIKKECTKIYNKYKDFMTTEENDIADTNGVFAIRTQYGTGPVVFIKDMPDFGYEARHEVRRWYAWQYKINYFEVRECSYDFWNNHEDSQIATA
jgi:hypothetical protein